MRYYLATTRISDIWDLEKEVILLGTWCLKNNMVNNPYYPIAASPWKSAIEIKEDADYCYNIYNELMTQLAERLNYIHNVSYPLKYWKILVGDWLLIFTEVLYERFRRMKNALMLFDFYTHVLPREQCNLITLDTNDFINRIVKEDYFNLKLFSLISYELCPDRIKEVQYEYKASPYGMRYSSKRKILLTLLKPLEWIFNGHIVLSYMYNHLAIRDWFSLILRLGIRNFSYINFDTPGINCSKVALSYDMRKRLSIDNNSSDIFKSILLQLIPGAIPVSYVENYGMYDKLVNKKGKLDAVKIIGSATGWRLFEPFKFFAAKRLIKGAKIVEFQHGGIYGTALAHQEEKMAQEKDFFYTWGWSCRENIKPLPSPHLSRLRDKYSPSKRSQYIVYVGNVVRRYVFKFVTTLRSDDIAMYFESKKQFLNALPQKIKNRVLYRLYVDKEWREIEEDYIRNIVPEVKFNTKGRLTELMQRAYLVVIDHPYTSFLEALAINVPCVLYWDHSVFLMRPEAEKYFDLLRGVEILHKDPVSAAEKVKRIFDNPLKWWLSPEVQKARNEFCERYAYTRRDWYRLWAEELKRIM